VSPPSLELLLSRNGCVFAGAGAGKTHGLLSAALGLLSGAGGQPPLAPGRLCLLTFTEKAAADMRERLSARVEALAEGRGEEPELLAAFAATGRAPPAASFWRGVQSQLDAATLSTFHAYCARLLRQAPAGADIPLGFELLGEEDSGELLVETAEQRLLDMLDAGDADVEALCSQGELRGVGRGAGLLDLLVGAVVRLREEGEDAARVEVGEPSAARRTLLLAAARAEVLVRGALPLCAEAALTAVLEASLDVLSGLDADAPAERLARLEALAGALPRTGKNGLRDALLAVRDALVEGSPALPGVVAAHAGYVACRHEATLRRLCSLVEADFRAALRRGGWMDFAELLVATRDVLRDDVGFRSSVQRRIGALLVDEVQDTNHLQLELVVLLSEARQGGPRPVPKERAAVLALPLEPRFLLAVGDRKQSIYDFRGADVSTFEALAEKVVAEGGARDFLRDNRRSSPALLAVLNAAARAALPEVPEPREYEVVFHPEEDGLVPVRAQVGPVVCVDALPVVSSARGTAREAEADVLARWLSFLLSEEGPETVVEGGVLRRARGGDVAILLRGFSGLEAYRSALLAHGVPHTVLREQNPYTAPSVLDAAALLALLSDRSDALSLAAVLRSPFVGLSDAALFRLSEKGRLEGRLLEEPLPEGFPEDEGQRLLRFAALLHRLSALVPALPLAGVLEVAWEETGYRAAVAAGPEGEEALLALERLLVLARQWDASGRGDAGALARRLRGLAEQTTVAGATGVEAARAGNAVQPPVAGGVPGGPLHHRRPHARRQAASRQAPRAGFQAARALRRRAPPDAAVVTRAGGAEAQGARRGWPPSLRRPHPGAGPPGAVRRRPVAGGLAVAPRVRPRGARRRALRPAPRPSGHSRDRARGPRAPGRRGQGGRPRAASTHPDSTFAALSGSALGSDGARGLPPLPAPGLASARGRLVAGPGRRGAGDVFCRASGASRRRALEPPRAPGCASHPGGLGGRRPGRGAQSPPRGAGTLPGGGAGAAPACAAEGAGRDARPQGGAGLRHGSTDG